MTMRLLPAVGFLAAGTSRSMAYVAAMDRAGIAPGAAIVLDAGASLTDELVAALGHLGIPSTRIATADINAQAVIDAVAASAWRDVVVSSPPGAILRRPLLETGRRFVHVHPGLLPDYRGSTTIYYSLLERGEVHATALRLDEGIDTGPVLLARSFAPPADRRTIDREFDPQIRAAVLEDVLRALAGPQGLAERAQPEGAGRVHYIIHPVLKHIAILAGEPASRRNEHKVS